MSTVKQLVVRKASRASLIAKKYSPIAMTAAGIVGVVVASVMACKATLKLEEVVADAQTEIENVHIDQELHPQVDHRRELAMAYGRSAFNFAKLYGPSVVVGSVAISGLIGGQTIMWKRNTGLALAYEAVSKSYEAYRARVVEDLGQDRDRDYARGTIKNIKEVDSEGNETVNEIGNGRPYNASEYARFYDDGSKNWSKLPENNLLFLRSVQNHMNDLLNLRGHVFLNEVYDALGIPRTSAGAVVGWVLNGGGDNYIDFGIYDASVEKRRDFVNGRERSIFLDFNVDGVIYNLIA